MRILQLTTGYAPRRGGMETVSSLLAREFARLGHASAVLTRTTTNAPADASDPVEVFRAPSPLTTLREIARADAVVLHGIPVRLAWPLALLRRPGVIVKHMWDRPDASRLRARIASRHPEVCVSAYMRALSPGARDLLPNPYDHTIFNDSSDTPRDRDLIFMGRVNRDKGVFEFLHVVKALAGARPALSATLVGDGPELDAARTFVRENGLESTVRFTGELSPAQAAAELRRHALLVFPALWDEPFGLVALEALACGAVVVGYRSGGIPEAAGPCGALVNTGDRDALVAETARLLDDPDARQHLIASRDEHLARHRADAAARRYVDYLRTLPQ